MFSHGQIPMVTRQDKDGHFRTSNRIKWWKHPREHTHDAVLFNCPVVLYNQPLPPDITFNVYPADAPPVFFGHYWLEDKIPAIQSHNVICLDYSVAKDENPIFITSFSIAVRIQFLY